MASTGFSAPSNHTIGGTAAGADNVVSGNGRGIEVSFNGNMVLGNKIGTAADGVTALGNSGDGVFVSGDNNTIGGLAAAGNIIAFNGSEGVETNGGSNNAIISNSIFSNLGPGVLVRFGRGNSILSNSIHSNAALGIDLFFTGPTPNDPSDADTAPTTCRISRCSLPPPPSAERRGFKAR